MGSGPDDSASQPVHAASFGLTRGSVLEALLNRVEPALYRDVLQPLHAEMHARVDWVAHWPVNEALNLPRDEDEDE